MSARARAGQQAARLLRGGMSAARSRLPEGDHTLVRLLRPLSSRVDSAIGGLQAPARREANDESQRWFDLGLSLFAEHRYIECVEAWFRAAETGSKVYGVLPAFHNRPPIRQIVGSPMNIDRVRALAAANPNSAQLHLVVGAFLLDQGRLELGRQTVRRGYQLLSNEPASERSDDAAEATPSLRPSFLVLGPHKAGTSALHHMLTQHPRMIVPARKELLFWDQRYGRSAEVYQAYFAPDDQTGEFMTGESSPTYLASPEAAAAAAQRFPELKAIVLRRDPVARAYSHFQMGRRTLAESRSFAEAISDERLLIGPVPPTRMDEVRDIDAPYLLGSCILPYLRMWIDALGAKRVIVLESEHLSRDPQSAIDALDEQLGLPPVPLADSKPRNVGEYAAIDGDFGASLRAWFAPHEAALDQLLINHPNTIPASRATGSVA